MKAGTLNNAFIQSLDWSKLTNGLAAFKAVLDLFIIHTTNVVEWWNRLQ